MIVDEVMLDLLSMNAYFFFNDSATPEIYTYWHTRSLHGALPIAEISRRGRRTVRSVFGGQRWSDLRQRQEEGLRPVRRVDRHSGFLHGGQQGPVARHRRRHVPRHRRHYVQ